MSLPNPKRKRRYPFKRQLKRKLRKIAFMLAGAILVSGLNYYQKHKANNTDQPFNQRSKPIDK